MWPLSHISSSSTREPARAARARRARRDPASRRDARPGGRRGRRDPPSERPWDGDRSQHGARSGRIRGHRRERTCGGHRRCSAFRGTGSARRDIHRYGQRARTLFAHMVRGAPPPRDRRRLRDLRGAPQLATALLVRAGTCSDARSSRRHGDRRRGERTPIRAGVRAHSRRAR